MVRISAAIAAIVLAVLLGFTIAGTFGRPTPVVPTGGIAGKRDDVPTGPAAEKALKDRTALQRWRAVAGPAPGVPTQYTVSGAPLPSEPPQTNPDALAKSWAARHGDDWGVLRRPDHLEGTVNIPKERAGVLIQPEGRGWRRLHNDDVSYIGGWIIFGVGLLLALFLLLRGRIPLELGFSGRTVLRFNAIERANHWMTASSFIVMVLTGLIILYGRTFLGALFGPGGANAIASASLYLHLAFAIPFVVGVIVMIVLWLRQNLPSRLDWHWLAHFGGFLNDSPDKPPARRFNAGQKLVFWGVALGGLLLFLSGLSLVFPFAWLDIQGMQTAMAVHSILALLMIGLIIGHIYIGTIGMVGAFDAMWTGRVDRNWAEEHHRLWLAEIEGHPPEALRDEAPRARPAPSPAE